MLLISLHDKLKILKKDIRNLTKDQIKEFCLDQGMKAYVSSQEKYHFFQEIILFSHQEKII